MIMIRRRARFIIWAFFLTAAFVTTHLPPADLGFVPKVKDTVLHFTGFTALGILTVWSTGGASRAITLRCLGLSVFGLAVYGVFDETTQPYFGRSCELSDWAADLAGAMAGTAITFAWYRIAGNSGGSRTRG